MIYSKAAKLLNINSLVCLRPTTFWKKLTLTASLLLKQHFLKILAPIGYCYAEKTINFCIPIPFVSPFHSTNTYIKESFLLAAITTFINSWRINQFKVQTLNFVDFFVFILLNLFSILKNLSILTIMN